MTPWLSPAYGAANVVMQLANAGVAYGVMESRVDSGNLHKHPFKRARTTFTYIAVAVAGNAEDRRIYRDAVNAVHAQVRSTPQSPVRYNAFDPALQLWVASCMAAVFEDTRRLRRGRTRHDPDTIYQAASVFATTLQVPREMWPPNREAFDDYWNQQLDRLEFDQRMREFLIGIARLDFLPTPIRWLFGGWNLFLTLGYLPPRLRDKLDVTWTAQQQRRFDRWQSVFRVLDRLTPRAAVRMAVRLVVWDMRLRNKIGATVV
ncbi:oxygenase MpaB family protein [Nocardia sp. CDC159]|uniref:Oxygenase MpaB family protein n=2 Tax=Nocardiaceae TaxID=85025 RepID=A0A9X2E567_9NOCA|nr:MULTISPECIES: oxygenase MpaB family protein [Nocardia]MCM6774004.1 oxygenase MpaB family protein [Nocardia pulmonis]MCM6786891.1 oxygenase MpaB family protein [Nocardia sp. CDC159]